MSRVLGRIEVSYKVPAYVDTNSAVWQRQELLHNPGMGMLFLVLFAEWTHSEAFTAFLNSNDPDIKFTTKEVEDGGLAFLDTNAIRKEDGSLKFTVHRKATGTNQYLNFTSNHPLIHKLCVVRTLYNRADDLVTGQDNRGKEKENIKKALHRCEYSDWDINLVTNPKPCPEKDNTMNSRKDKRGLVRLPYITGVSEDLRSTCILKSYSRNVFYKPYNTLCQILVRPKDNPKGEYMRSGVQHQG